MRWRLLAGLFLTFGSLLILGLSLYLVTSAHDAQARVDDSWEKADIMCRTSLSEYGEVDAVGGRLIVRQKMSNTDDWRVALMNASSLISYCPTRQMSYFCMGRGCAFDQSKRIDIDEIDDQSPVIPMVEAMRKEPVKIHFQLIEVR